MQLYQEIWHLLRVSTVCWDKDFYSLKYPQIEINSRSFCKNCIWKRLLHVLVIQVFVNSMDPVQTSPIWFNTVCWKGVLNILADNKTDNILVEIALRVKLWIHWIQRIGHINVGAQWLSGRVLDSRSEGQGVQASLASLLCVLEKDTLFLA